jgi:hypothetical protein
VKAAPVMALALGLLMVMLNTLTSPAAMVLGVKALATAGATKGGAPAITVKEACAEAPAPALALLTAPLLLT